MGKITFLDNVESAFSGFEPERYEQIAHAVLYHLWRRLPFDERQALLAVLPESMADLVTEQKSPHEPMTTIEQCFKAEPIESDDVADFLAQIRKETGLVEEHTDQEAIRAVFEALKAELPEEEVLHIHEVLPSGVKPMWAGA